MVLFSLIGIGGKLSSGEAHDVERQIMMTGQHLTKMAFAGLNGDILVWNPSIARCFEVSSMGIRVDPETLMRQLTLTDDTQRLG